MVTMAEWRDTFLPPPLDSSSSIPPASSSFGAPPSPDIRFVVQELWGQGEQPGGGDSEPPGVMQEPWEEQLWFPGEQDFQKHGEQDLQENQEQDIWEHREQDLHLEHGLGEHWDQSQQEDKEQGLRETWEQDLPWDSSDNTLGPELASATPVRHSACISDGHVASDACSSQTLDEVPPPDAWSPQAGPEEPLSGVSHSLGCESWEPQGYPQAGQVEPHSALPSHAGCDSRQPQGYPSADNLDSETCGHQDLRLPPPEEAGYYTSSDSAFPGSGDELSRRSSLSNVSSLPGLSGNLSTCPESPALASSHEGLGSFRADVSPCEGAHGEASDSLGSRQGASPPPASPLSSSVAMLDAPSSCVLQGHLLGGPDFQSNNSAEVLVHLPLASERKDHGANPPLQACQAAPVAHLGYSTGAPGVARSGSLASRLAGLLQGIARDKRVKEESDKEPEAAPHEPRGPEDTVLPQPPAGHSLFAGLPGEGALVPAPVEKRARVQSASVQEDLPEQELRTDTALLPNARNPRARRKAAAGLLQEPASAADKARSSAPPRNGTKGTPGSRKPKNKVASRSSGRGSGSATLGPASVPGAGLGGSSGSPLVYHPAGAHDAWLSPADALSLSFVPLGPSIPGGIRGQLSHFNDARFQKQVMGQLMRLATAYSTGQEEMAHRWLVRLRKLAAPRGHRLQRLVSYILTGLTQRFEGSGSGAAPSLLPPQDATPEALANIVETSRNGIREAYGRFSEVAMTAHLVRRLLGHPRVHLVCFSTCLLPDWPPLFAALAAQEGGLRPRVRVSIVVMGAEVSQFPQLLSAYSFLSSEVVACGRAAGLETECRMAFSTPQDFRPSLVAVDPQECIAVTAWMSLHTLPDESVLRHNPRNAVLKWIWGLRPVAFALVELDASYNSPFFLARFSEILRVAAAAFGVSRERALGLAAAGAPRPDGEEGEAEAEGGEAPSVVEAKKAQDLINCIACEGLARHLRSESMALWRDRLQRLGFLELRYAPGDLARMRSEVLHLGLAVDPVGGLASVSREGSPLVFAGAWTAGT